MVRPRLEVADIFRAHGPAWRRANAGHVGRPQLRVMSAIEACRTEVLGGHVAACSKCGHQHVAYNSCKNRHCPKCQGPAARDWMAARAEDLLPVEYFHVVFTLPAEVARIAHWNKREVYGLLFRASAETVTTIAADPRRLGVRIGMTSVLHTWGSALTHHPHVHMIVPGGGLSSGDTLWVPCRPGFFLPVRVLSRLFRRLFLEGLSALHGTGKLAFFGDLEGLADAEAFAAWLAPACRIRHDGRTADLRCRGERDGDLLRKRTFSGRRNPTSVWQGGDPLRVRTGHATRLNPSPRTCQGRSLAARAYADLGKDRRHVVIDGFRRYEQLLGDLGV